MVSAMDTKLFAAKIASAIDALPKAKNGTRKIDALDPASIDREVARSMRNRCAEQLQDGTIAMRVGYQAKIVALLASVDCKINASDVDILYGKALERLAMPVATRTKIDIDAIVATAVAKALAEYKASNN